MYRTSRALVVALAALAAATPALAAAKRSLASIVTDDAFLPAVHIVGATGTFRTDVTIFNPQEHTLVVDLYFTPADTNGSNLPGLTITGGIFARETITLTDVVGSADYFNRASAYGVLNVRTSLPQGGTPGSATGVIVTSNTYNVAGAQAGTYGQFSPAQPFEDALGFDESFAGELYTPGLPNDANHRVNAVVINPTGVSMQAGVQLVDASGQVYGSIKTYEVPPYSMHQINDVFAEFGASNPPVGVYRLSYFVNRNDTGAKILSYATVTDRRTGDPYLIPGLTMFR